ncbi:hypothetical protein CBL_20448 [Carabus blaptoides fortunei]
MQLKIILHKFAFLLTEVGVRDLTDIIITQLPGLHVSSEKKQKEILFMGVSNKYCSICYVASNRGVEAATHKCYKNWDHSSSGMEADIIVRGFNFSEEMHKLQYTSFVGDGDSSVYARIRERVSYGKNVKQAAYAVPDASAKPCT